MLNVNIYDYTNPNEYLRARLCEKQKLNPKFSLRAWSKQLGSVHPGLLSMVLNGKRRLQTDLSLKICDALKLENQQREYFQMLVLYSNANRLEEKEIYANILKTLRPDNDFSTLSIDQFRMISDWYHMTILEMVRLKYFKNNPVWIANQLGSEISPEQVEAAIERLIRLKLLVRTADGKLKRCHLGQIETVTDIPSVHIRAYHRQMIHKAAEALENQSVSEREIVANIVAIKKNDIARAKKLITEFRNLFCKQIEAQTSADDVYHLNIQFFNLTQGEKR